jgi:hypothetical protein
LEEFKLITFLDLERAQQIVVRNARRAEAARLRYQRMNPEERKVYNQKRYTPKRKRDDQPGPSTSVPKSRQKDDEFDALSTLEREVMKRTQQALVRQRMNQPVQQQQIYPATTNQPTPNVTFTNASGTNTTVGAHLMQQVQQPAQQMQFY